MRRLPSSICQTHPIATQRYAVFTSAIDSFVEKLGSWIDAKVTGAYVYGPSRFGKTRAIKWFLRQLLEERFGGAVPLHVLVHTVDTRRSQSEFYRSILVALGHAYAKGRSTSSERLNMIVEYFIASANECNSNYAILVIDEAQNISTLEWMWLLNVQNLLDMQGYALSVFSVASHQMSYEFDLLARTGNPHLSARFLVDQWKFPGVESEEDLAFILDGYDESSRWPAENGVSYLAYFAPEDYARGKRLAHCAPVLWGVLDASLPPGYKGEASFPMKHIALAVESILFRLAAGELWDDATCEPSWIHELTTHRFADHMRAISMAS
ncbi:ATP-binding protein [Roseateles albus]|uniref:ATP-binding protein n=1 Tax=Roseateles albus TaxID=2987525 RepID=A0ABT5KKX5_9BURK|nr:ATP-binding protein [Roseateles albus]MDC8774516.1 ATP-binding protein [Roseateles albus]